MRSPRTLLLPLFLAASSVPVPDAAQEAPDIPTNLKKTYGAFAPVSAPGRSVCFSGAGR